MSTGPLFYSSISFPFYSPLWTFQNFTVFFQPPASFFPTDTVSPALFGAETQSGSAAAVSQRYDWPRGWLRKLQLPGLSLLCLWLLPPHHAHPTGHLTSQPHPYPLNLKTTLDFLDFETQNLLGCSSHSLLGSFCSRQPHFSSAVSVPTSASAPIAPTLASYKEKVTWKWFYSLPFLREIFLVSLGSQK